MPTANRPLAPVSVTNRLLTAVPRKDYRRLLTSLTPVTLTLGETLYQPGEPIRQVYFPEDCVVSLLAPVDRHRALEVGLIGREGLVGIPLALGISVSPVRALVQGTGTAMRMSAARFGTELRDSRSLRQELYRFSHMLMTQTAQVAACNRFHVMEARLARWLLMIRDRVPSNTFHLTQDFLAQMLGVQRPGVSRAAAALQRKKLIRYSRGDITILNRKGLEAAACRCYRIIRDVYGTQI